MRILVYILVCALFLAGCGGASDEPDVPDEPNEPVIAQVAAASVPQGVTVYDKISVTVNGVQMVLYSVKTNNSHVWSANPTSRTDTPVCYFYKSAGQAEVTVSVPYDLTAKTVIRPLSAKIEATDDTERGEIRFTVKECGAYTVEPNMLAVNTVHIFVRDIDYEMTDINDGNNIIRFEAGLHDKDSSPYINQSNAVQLSSNTTVILEEGAVVRARFNASDAVNIQIIGRGIIDGSVFERNASTNARLIPLDFSRCKNILLKDFSVHDAAGWCVNFFFAENSKIEGVNIFTSRSNGDGISLQSCKNIKVSDCFLRTWDDALVVKNYPVVRYTDNHGATNGILFERCMLWIDLAQAMEIGYETVGEQLENVTFKDITVLHAFHKPVISIHNANNANIKNILYENITVENARMGMGDADWNYQLIDIRNTYNATWSTNHAHTTLGSIDGVTIRNVEVIEGRQNIPVLIAGAYDSRYGTYHYVKNVTMENIVIKGEKIDSSYPYLNISGLTENIVIA